MLSLEPLLRTRLEQLGLFRGVWGLADLSAEKSKPTPCAYVIFDGAKVLDERSDGAEARLAARWLVALAIKNVSGAADGAPARADSQALVAPVLAALMGWRPAAGHPPLKLAECPRPEFHGGLLFLPLAFQTVQIVKGV